MFPLRAVSEVPKESHPEVRIPFRENEMKPSGFVTKKDKNGVSFLLGKGGPDDYGNLLDMYQVFSPKPAAQGLPPPDEKTCSIWVKTILTSGISFLAFRGESAIGHAALIPDLERKDCEFLIFVHQEHRNRGIGTALTDMAVREAQALGCNSIWLCVETKNISAIKLYEKFGFEFCDQDISERKMILDLTSS